MYEFWSVDITLTWVLPLIDKTTTPYVTQTNSFHRVKVQGYDRMIQRLKHLQQCIICHNERSIKKIQCDIWIC